MYYLLSVVQVYLISECVKHSGFVHLISYKHNEDFAMFVNNMCCCVIVIYVLTREIISDYSVLDYIYWFIVSVSTVALSLFNNFSLFQFSIQQTSKFTHSQIILCISILVLMLLLIVYQFYMRRVQYKLFLPPSALYILSYLLFYSIGAKIRWHLHHAITFGFLSLCFTDFNSKMNRFFHAIMIGGVIQGINIYGTNELLLFYIEYTPPPKFMYILFLCSGYFVCMLIMRKWKEWKYKETNISSSEEISYIAMI